MPEFKGGDIAIFKVSRINPGKIGLEVLITEDLGKVEFTEPSVYTGKMEGICYLIKFPGDQLEYAAFPFQLAKKPPKQDWDKLCNLNSIDDDIVYSELSY